MIKLVKKGDNPFVRTNLTKAGKTAYSIFVEQFKSYETFQRVEYSDEGSNTFYGSHTRCCWFNFTDTNDAFKALTLDIKGNKEIDAIVAKINKGEYTVVIEDFNLLENVVIKGNIVYKYKATPFEGQLAENCVKDNDGNDKLWADSGKVYYFMPAIDWYEKAHTVLDKETKKPRGFYFWVGAKPIADEYDDEEAELNAADISLRRV